MRLKSLQYLTKFDEPKKKPPIKAALNEFEGLFKLATDANVMVNVVRQLLAVVIQLSNHACRD